MTRGSERLCHSQLSRVSSRGDDRRCRCLSVSCWPLISKWSKPPPSSERRPPEKKHRRHTELNYSRRNHAVQRTTDVYSFLSGLKKGSPYLVTERRVPELIPVLGSQPAGDVSHKLGGRLPLLSGRSAVTTATLKRAATNFATWWTEVQWVWTVCLRLLPEQYLFRRCYETVWLWITFSPSHYLPSRTAVLAIIFTV